MYLRGLQTLTVSASDVTGIRVLGSDVDGVSRSSVGRSCATTPMSLRVSNEPGARAPARHDIDCRRSRTLSVRWPRTRPAAKLSRTLGITVDNTAPSAPLKVQVRRPRGSRPTSPRLELTWSNPAGQVAPVAAAHWKICRRTTPSRCQTGSRSGGFARSNAESTGLLLAPRCRTASGMRGCGSKTRPERRSGEGGWTVASRCEAKDPRIRIMASAAWRSRHRQGKSCAGARECARARAAKRQRERAPRGLAPHAFTVGAGRGCLGSEGASREAAA